MIKVGVFFGGKSIEREVSFNSGRTVCDHLDTSLFQVIPIFQAETGVLYILPWSFVHRGKIADFYHRLEKQAVKIVWDDLPKLIDFAYIAMHGTFAEDGRLQAVFELFKIPYLGTKIFGSSVGMNKIIHNLFLKSHGIKTPKGFALSVQQVCNANAVMLQHKMLEADIDFPVIVKPQSEGSSIGVFVCKDMDQLIKLVQQSCFIIHTDGQDVMIEEKIQGMEFNAIVISDLVTGQFVALPPTEIIHKANIGIFDYHQKYMPGAAYKKTPARCSVQDLEKIKATAIQVMQALSFETIARIDGFLTESGEVIVLDSNPISGMDPSSFVFRQAAEVGMSHAALINHLIKSELKYYSMEKVMTKEQGQAAKKVAVLFGGPSNEKEISLESGRNVCYKLASEKYAIIPIFMDKNHQLFQLCWQTLVCTSTSEIEALLDKATSVQWSDLKSLVDFVFIALHGAPGENGIVQGMLEMLEIPYNGSSVFTSALCMDKFKTTQFLKAQGFDVPAGFVLSKKDFVAGNLEKLDTFLATIAMPCIVKPADDGCSVLVSAPKNYDNLMTSLAEIFEQKEQALIEELVVGMELTVGVVGNKNPKALVPSQAIAKAGLLSVEEKFLPGAGENQTPALLPEEDIVLVQQTIEQAFVAVKGQGYARIDCFFQDAIQSPTGKKRVVILEVNTLPGLTPATCLFHQAAELGMRPFELLDQIVQLGFDAHQPYQILSVDDVLAKHDVL